MIEEVLTGSMYMSSLRSRRGRKEVVQSKSDRVSAVLLENEV